MKRVKIVLIIMLLLLPLWLFPQLRSVAMTLQLKTQETQNPPLFYMLNDTIVYDLGEGNDGKYDICLPGKMVNDSAAFAVQSEKQWIKIATIGSLENNHVCNRGTMTLTLLGIERVMQGDPENPKEFKTPPRPHQPTLLIDDHFFDENPFQHANHLLLVTLSADDSLYCSRLLPKQAFDGNYYLEFTCLKYPQAKCLEKTMDSLRKEFCDFYYECERQEQIKLTVYDMTFIVDEVGFIRGIYCFVEKEQLEHGKNVAIKILKHFKNERFSPAINAETYEPVPDIVEFFVSNCISFEK